MKVANEVCPGFVIYEEQKEVIADVFRWCMRLPGKYDPSRGLWIWGSIGSGKSTLLKIINRFCNLVRPEELKGDERYKLPFCLRIRTALQLCDDYSSKGFAGLEKTMRISRLAIDDLGIEARTTNYYGTVTNVIRDVLLRRYDMRLRFETHVTSNLHPSQILDVYGARVFDRCGELFNFVHFNGPTHRPPIEN